MFKALSFATITQNWFSFFCMHDLFLFWEQSICFFSVAVFFLFFPSNAWKCPFLPLRNIPSDNQVKGNSLLGVLHNSICRFLWLFLAFDFFFFFNDSDFLFFIFFLLVIIFKQRYQTLYKHKQNMSSRILSWNLHTYCNVESWYYSTYVTSPVSHHMPATSIPLSSNHILNIKPHVKQTSAIMSFYLLSTEFRCGPSAEGCERRHPRYITLNGKDN